MVTLAPKSLYRLSYSTDDPKLRGKAVVFLEWVEARWFDIRRALVAEINRDGSLGQTWKVTPGLIIPHS